MKSRASIAGHPIHPSLIVYPFAFLTGAFGFNLGASILRRDDWRLVADRLVPAGVTAGLAAAIPGVIDYLNSVPPRSSAKERATTHALLNSAGLVLFTASSLLGGRGRRRLLPLLLQAAGSGALSAAAYMGGTLVYRNQIGVDHRYADAGKWTEEARGGDPQALAAAANGLGVDQMKLVHSDQGRVVVACTEKGAAAFDDRCTHKGGPLSDGVLICGTVQCPWHGSQFDVHTGEVRRGPATEAVHTYHVAGAGGSST
jgi:nitrite reductase/ring-hydroxylating ferredoxin subunit/uncharacterized membrane protein